ncbi:hypothetical protein CEJ87_15910 [Caldifermentibacillus hisashii]|jgi:hypothetical protein|nr:hypothetical protein CEJ87_15910 [Caldifermentibacillus hisashii]
MFSFQPLCISSLLEIKKSASTVFIASLLEPGQPDNQTLSKVFDQYFIFSNTVKKTPSGCGRELNKILSLVFKMNDNLILTAYMKKIYIKNGKSATNRSFSYVFVCC